MFSEINMKNLEVMKNVKIRISPSIIIQYFEKLKTNHNIFLSHIRFILLEHTSSLWIGFHIFHPHCLKKLEKKIHLTVARPSANKSNFQAVSKVNAHKDEYYCQHCHGNRFYFMMLSISSRTSKSTSIPT